ncbi:SPFH domain-containing protein [Actinospica sp.]|uniref:SPFH domain-containing protein n=1 Tax=Actinospica sp. TaxID=1872142 RepID=UPI002D0BB0EA|nr:SPFH domain-containing protein [Actinospica sp.]HWG28309.1 SPFH domain-containing protein [Actinospica sp.]
MAHITRRPFFSHYRGTGTGHVVHLKHGKVAHQGVGQAFWFRPLGTVLSEVPADDRELPLVFRGRTADFQEAAVQGSVTYRFADPLKAARRLDFGLDPTTGVAQGTPLDQVAGLLTELAQEHALSLLASLPLAEALSEGPAAVRARIVEGLSGDPRLGETGLEIVDTRVVAIRPEADVERALRAPARELIQQQADRAGFERRAEAVNRERAIAENELQNRIELATREEQLVARQGANERRKVQEAAEAAKIKALADAERVRIAASAQAEQLRELGEAEASAAAARMHVYEGQDPRILLAIAAQSLAGSLPSIGTLNLTPDVLTAALSSLSSGSSGASGSSAGAGS